MTSDSTAFGEEDFLLEEAYNKLITAAIGNDENSCTIDTVDSDSASAETVVSMASSFPFMSERRVVSVKNFEKYFSGRSKKSDDKSPFARYFQSPQPTTLLILRSSASELNGIGSALLGSKHHFFAE
ncbi:MAG: hypothetical protein IPM69_05640 [Ignavibacteria bacterium]|nr:hypothetical protein [Ignavibacteria bacterium]